ncbi:hypothetical protein dqs_3390 [Azoarcus olearius]|uniref:glycosyltransferase n=1 Tax=Azoarcus sp. (strain BH72) TaxID=418699 RepID=UPI0008062390|nr:glycosyltransferase [Azoarcus olearius]ANQ86411.1 hypothetical protein dqs_3390 [Azoarcus olearius]
MKRILMIAYHFPPVQGSSGVQRTLRFARYLPEFGWEPIILTAHTRAYENTTPDQLADVPAGTVVVRAPAWDTARHLAIGGRYPGFLARPDRWLTWWLGAVPAGLGLIRKYAPAAIWSTYPIATAHSIAATLHARSGLPWIADFRDPMAQDDYPEDPATWESFARIERRAIEQASLSVFTTPSALELYRERYPRRTDSLALLENGYDEETFTNAAAGEPLHPGKLTLLHSGIVYPSERDPTHLIAALARLKASAPAIYGRLRIRFRAPVHADLLHALAQRHGVDDVIETCPSIDYRDALAEMMRADGLLVLQAANCNAQIPAKLYEYFRAGRPILALTDPAGDTAVTCRSAGISAIARLDDEAAIVGCLERFCTDPAAGTLATAAAIAGASRRGRTAELARMLDATVLRAAA